MNKPYLIAEMGVNFYDTAKVMGISPLDAAKLYIDDYLKKKTTILANAEKGKDINIDIFMPKVTEVTISDFARYLQKAIETQPKEERAKHRKFFQ